MNSPIISRPKTCPVGLANAFIAVDTNRRPKELVKTLQGKDRRSLYFSCIHTGNYTKKNKVQPKRLQKKPEINTTPKRVFPVRFALTKIHKTNGAYTANQHRPRNSEEGLICVEN